MRKSPLILYLNLGHQIAAAGVEEIVLDERNRKPVNKLAAKDGMKKEVVKRGKKESHKRRRTGNARI